MNHFLPPKNPLAAVWKTALRILGITLLSFLFVPEGWGQEKDLNVKEDIPTDAEEVILTYTEAEEWSYKTASGGNNSEPANFNGILTGTIASGSPAGFYFTIKNEHANTTHELKLKDFHFSGTKGVFRIEGSNTVKITAENACTLQCTGTPENDASFQEKSVVYVPEGSTLELNIGSGDMTVQNTQQATGIYGLYNEGTTTLSGKINFTAQTSSSQDCAIFNDDNGMLKAEGTHANITAIGDTIYHNAQSKYESPFICWHFTLPPNTVVIKKVEGTTETPVATFTNPEQNLSKSFLIPGEAGASYAVYADGKRQMGKKRTGVKEGADIYGDSFTDTFVATASELSSYGDLFDAVQAGSFPELQDAIQNASTDPDDPTLIWLTGDIDLSGLAKSINMAGKHIEINGKGNKIIASDQCPTFDFSTSETASSLTLSNVTVECQTPASKINTEFIGNYNPKATITLGNGFQMIHGESTPANVYGVNMRAGILIMEKGAEIKDDMNEESTAIKINSRATLELHGGKIHNIKGIGLNLYNNDGHNIEFPTVTIKGDLGESVFEGVYLTGYIGKDGNILNDVVITTDSRTLTNDDLKKFPLKAVELSGTSTPNKGYELYLDTDEKTIKLRKFPLSISDVTFSAEKGYSPTAQTITIENTTGTTVYITTAKLVFPHGTFNKPLVFDLPFGVPMPIVYFGKITCTIQPIADLPVGEYTATIEVKADGHTGTGTAKIIFTVTEPYVPGPGTDPDPLPEYTFYEVTLPHIPGATTDPVAGTYLVSEGGAFQFKLTVLPDYNLSTPVVQVGDKVLQPDLYGFYHILNVWHNQTITITGIALNPVDPPIGNAGIDAPVKVWAEGHTLYIYTASRETIRLYTFSGQLLKQTDHAGQLAVPDLPEGNYLIRVGDKTWKVAL